MISINELETFKKKNNLAIDFNFNLIGLILVERQKLFLRQKI